MQKLLKNWITILLLMSLGFFSVSCNTMQGMGEDVEAAGEEIQETAE
ncbi:MAG TPA: entericidin A/B family lipoprotein [Desulfotignum sp.]|nr:entericidin A/B family lipoprotein [Desulfotignum sp.]